MQWNGSPLSLRYLYDDPITHEGGQSLRDKDNNQCQYQNMPDIIKSQFPMLGTSDINTGKENVLELPSKTLVYMLTSLWWPKSTNVDTDGWVDTGYTGDFLGCFGCWLSWMCRVSIYRKQFHGGQYKINNMGALYLFPNSGLNFSLIFKRALLNWGNLCV